MELRFEPAGKADIECIYSLNKELIEAYEDMTEIDYAGVLSWVRQKLFRHISEYTCVFYEERKVAYYYFHCLGEKMELDDLYVLPEFRCRGIGTAILNKCIAEADNPIFLYVFAKNKGAVSLYLRMGFKIEEKIKNTRYIMLREK